MRKERGLWQQVVDDNPWAPWVMVAILIYMLGLLTGKWIYA